MTGLLGHRAAGVVIAERLKPAPHCSSGAHRTTRLTPNSILESGSPGSRWRVIRQMSKIQNVRAGTPGGIKACIPGDMVQADYLFLLTDVDCLYTDNPRTCPDAKPIGDVRDLEALRNKVTVATPGSSLGTGGMVTKLIAADLATAAGVTTVITNGSFPRRALAILAAAHPELFQSSVAPTDLNFSSEPESAVPEGCDSQIIGKVTPFGTVQLHTRILAKPHTLVDRTWWVMHGLHDAGALVVDENSVTASVRHRSALFASGVLRVDGQFAANQAVRVYVERKAGTEVERVLVGKGLVNYTSTEIELIKGRDPSEISDLLGYGDAESVIHRENFAIVLRPEDTV
ncbi:MAG: hypothetical protein BJ554DRAFT_3209 [Olpidium bornovanus]|uniref:PUA domain-containing protein n=1 Tax=Olpidium bornovanus TaxID=278681 RepID=A0A8H7ZNT5_9FUNG|nr:MAG: hypothetical protein BJ554DRAFT_3209 [Olpidium bornovanus]